MKSGERRNVNVLEMRRLKSLVGVSRIDRILNENVSIRYGIERELSSRVDHRVLRWYGHIDIMDEYHMARTV